MQTYFISTVIACFEELSLFQSHSYAKASLCRRGGWGEGKRYLIFLFLLENPVVASREGRVSVISPPDITPPGEIIPPDVSSHPRI